MRINKILLTILIFLLVPMFSYAQLPIENIDDITDIVFTWIPNKKLHDDNIEYTMEQKYLINRFVQIFNKSEEIDWKTILFVNLIEGRYLFTVNYKNKDQDIFEVFGNGNYIQDMNRDQYYLNNDMYNYVVQFMFSLLIYNGIKITQ